MLNYIKGEIYRIFHSISYYVVHAISLLYGIIIWLVMFLSNKRSPIKVPINFCEMFNSLVPATAVDLLVFLAVIFAMTVFGSDYRNGTMKNVIGMGISKTKVFFGKYLISLIIIMFIYVSTILVSGGICAISGGFGEMTRETLTRFFLKCTFLALFTFMFCGVEHLIQSSGGTMAIAIMTLVLAPSIVSIFSLFVKNKVLKKAFYVEWTNGTEYVIKHGFALSNSIYLIISACIMIGIGAVCYVFYRKKDVK